MRGNSYTWIIWWIQFVLDMQFVIQVAINGRFSSRHMRQVVNDVTARAVTAFAATGGDPHRSVLIGFFSFVTDSISVQQINGCW